jgi:hypothetical protein
LRPIRGGNFTFFRVKKLHISHLDEGFVLIFGRLSFVFGEKYGILDVTVSELPGLPDRQRCLGRGVIPGVQARPGGE